MRLLKLAAGILLTFGSLPASAQSGDELRSESRRLDDRIQANVRNGRFTRGEAEVMRAELRQIGETARRFSADGLDPGEREELRRRMERLGARIGNERQNGDRRGRYRR